MFDHLTVQGYAYTSLRWRLIEPVTVRKGPMGYSLRDHLFSGGTLEGTVKPAGTVTQAWDYLVKLDLSANAVAEATATLTAEGTYDDPEAPLAAIGVARVRRYAEGAQDAEAGELRVPLEDFDRSHLMDRLVSAVLTWHAELHGEGPWPKNQAA